MGDYKIVIIIRRIVQQTKREVLIKVRLLLPYGAVEEGNFLRRTGLQNFNGWSIVAEEDRF
ncbi:MAG: hypothetical protein QXG12_08185 [Thermoproteota archaeon]